MMRMKEGFFGLNILAACNALSLLPDNTDLLVEDMGEFSVIINSVSTSCFTHNSREVDISFSFKLPCLFLSLLDGYSISVAVISNTRTWNFEFPLYLKTKKYP